MQVVRGFFALEDVRGPDVVDRGRLDFEDVFLVEDDRLLAGPSPAPSKETPRGPSTCWLMRSACWLVLPPVPGTWDRILVGHEWPQR